MDSRTASEPISERIVRVGRREIFVAELGAGPPLVMLHGGGPGAERARRAEKHGACLSGPPTPILIYSL